MKFFLSSFYSFRQIFRWRTLNVKSLRIAKMVNKAIKILLINVHPITIIKINLSKDWKYWWQSLIKNVTFYNSIKIETCSLKFQANKWITIFMDLGGQCHINSLLSTPNLIIFLFLKTKQQLVAWLLKFMQIITYNL